MKNIILFSIDNLRYDCVGYQPDKSELKRYDCLGLLDSTTFDKIADRSICLTNCFSTNTYTTSAHASLLTGLYPAGHGVRTFYDNKLSKDVYTLAEVLKVFGYTTILHTDVTVHFEPLEIHRGFDHIFGNNEDENLFRLLKKLRRENKNVFLLIHVFDVHEPYLLSESPLSEDYNDDYFLEMKRMYDYYGVKMDENLNPHSLYFHLALLKRNEKTKKDWMPVYIKGATKFYNGRFKYFVDNFEELNYFDDSLFFFFSDHGEGRITLEAQESFSHGGLLFEDVLRIPMVIYTPGRGHRVDDRLASIVDVFPTVFETVSGHSCMEVLPYNIDGVNLLAQRERVYVYSEKWFCKSSPIELDSSGKTWKVTEGIYRDVEPFLMQRCFMTDNEKVIIWGNPEELIFRRDSILKIEPSLFIDRLYKSLLLRKPREEGRKMWFERLQEKENGRETLLREFAAFQVREGKISCEYYDKRANIHKRFTFIELIKLLSDNSTDNKEYIKIVEMALKEMQLMEDMARSGETVFLPGKGILNKEDTRYIFPLNYPKVMKVNQMYEFDIRLKNISNVQWNYNDKEMLGGPIRLSYHWYNYKDKGLIFNGLRTHLPSVLKPDEEVEIKAKVLSPPETGEYILEFDMVIENVNWLKNLGFNTTTVKITVI